MSNETDNEKGRDTVLVTKPGAWVDEGRHIHFWLQFCYLGRVCLSTPMSHHAPDLEHHFLTRRQMLSRVGMGLGSVAMTHLFGEGTAQAASQINSQNPLAMRQPQFDAKAKRVVHFFMNGGPSHVDTFDPKPMLTKMDGKALSTSRATALPRCTSSSRRTSPRSTLTRMADCRCRNLALP